MDRQSEKLDLFLIVMLLLAVLVHVHCITRLVLRVAVLEAKEVGRE
jgi:hypothetical protein